MTYYVYILQSKVTGKYYVGQTKNLSQRLKEHNSGQTKSTKHGIPWEHKYIKEFSMRKEAVNYENKIKKMKSSKYIETLIAAR